MSRHRHSACGIVLTGVLALAAGCGDGDPSLSAELQRSVDSLWSSYQARNGVPSGGLAVYVTTPSEACFAASGMAGVDEETHFRVASNTKSFTAAAILLLDEQGRLRIEDKIVSMIPGKTVPYVPDTSDYDIPHKSEITIRQLMSHTAGVFDVTNSEVPTTCAAPYAGQSYLSYVTATEPDHQFSPDELVKVVATCELSYFAPGADYKYSNTGYSLLATIIERVSGTPYDRFVRENLLEPNALTATSIPMLGTDRAIPAPYADGYLYEDGKVTRVTEDNMSGNIAEGNIISTPVDLTRWIRRLMRGEAGLSTASVEAMRTPTTQSGKNNYGYGIFSVAGLGHGHNGAHAGYLSLMMHDTSSDVTLAVYFNIWDVEHLLEEQAPLLQKVATDARAALGY